MKEATRKQISSRSNGECCSSPGAKVVAAGVCAVAFCVPPLIDGARGLARHLSPPIWDGLRFAVVSLLFVLCSMSLAAGTHDPFIYFRF